MPPLLAAWALVAAGVAAEPAAVPTAESRALEERCAALLDRPAAPHAARHLFAAAALRPWVPPGAVEACLDRVLDAPGLPAPLRRAAHALRATLALEDGDEASARAEAERAGVVADWEVAGPFRDPRRNPLAGGGTVAEAVAALRDDPAATLAGRRGAVAFRAPPAPRPDGVLDLERAVPLGDGACALLRLALPAGGATELLLGGAPAFTVWLEGSRAAAEPISIPAARGDAAPDRLAVAVPASRAPRVALVGVCPEGGPAVVRAFLGRGGSDVERAARILADPPSRDPDALLAAAELLVEAGALPRDADPLAGPLSALPAERAAPAALLLARSSVTAADRHAAAARAARLRPDDLEAWLAVAREGSALADRAGVDEALERAAAFPFPSMRVATARARALLADGLPLRAAAALDARDDDDAPPEVLRTLAEIAAARGDATAAAGLAERRLAARPADPDAWSARLDAAVAAGRYDDARAWLAAPPFVPAGGGEGPVPSLALERLAAATWLRLGDVERAVAARRRLAAERPADETAWFDLGWTLALAGREDEAERALREGLRLQPTDPLARSWIAAREEPDPLVDRLLGRDLDPDDLTAATDAAFPSAAAAYALRAAAAWVESSGTVRERHRRMLLVRVPSGAAELRRLPLASYDASRTVFRLRLAAVRDSAGRARGGAKLRAEGLDLPEERLYGSAVLSSLELPPLSAGDLVEVEFELVDVAPSSLPDGALAREFPAREAYPTALLRVGAIAPETVPLRLAGPAGVPGRRDEGAGGGRRWVSWEAERLPAVEPEPLGPPLRELAGAVRVSTFAVWAEVGDWIARLFEHAGADRRVADLGEGRDAAAVYREVASRVRYVAIEYGRQGLEPDPPAVTLARGYGDCKDKVALLIAALAAAGVEARPTLVRTRYAGIDPFAAEFPYAYAFDHVVAWLPPPFDRYVDPTATRLPWDVLPRADRGAAGLVLDPTGPRPVTLPEAAPEEEGLERRDTIFFDPTGEAALLGEITAGGADAGDLRELLAAPDLRAPILAALLDRDLPDAEIVAVDLAGLEPDAPRLRAAYVGSVPGFARTTPRRLEVPLGVRFDLVERFAPLERRRTDLELSVAGFPVRWRRDVRIAPTAGWVWSEVPAEVREVGAFGRFSLAARDEGGTLRVSVELAIDRMRVAAAEYREFRAFLARIDAALAAPAAAVRRNPGE